MKLVVLKPGTPAAIKEAVRLLTGHVPEVQPRMGTLAPYWCTPCEVETDSFGEARMALLRCLEELQPAATVRP